MRLEPGAFSGTAMWPGSFFLSSTSWAPGAPGPCQARRVWRTKAMRHARLDEGGPGMSARRWEDPWKDPFDLQNPIWPRFR